MARIRTIKPEFWSSEQVVACSPLARLLFIGLWNFADDNGVHPASVSRLRMEVFPGDDITAEVVGELMQELHQHGLVGWYSAQGQAYWHVTGWHHHQHINRPTPSRHPLPPGIHGRLTEDSLTALAGREGKGRERKGKEGSGKEKAHVPCDPAGDLASGIRDAPPRPETDPAPRDLLDEAQCPPELATPAVRDAIREFNEYRREKRWGAMSARSWSKVWKSFTGFTPSDFTAAVDASIAAGWRGIFPPKGTPHGHRRPGKILAGAGQVHDADRQRAVGEF